MQKGDRVVMLKEDGFCQKGWAGIITAAGTHSDTLVRVMWDCGKTFLHKRTFLGPENINDPNILFKRRKLK